MAELYIVPSSEPGEPEPDRNETSPLAPEAHEITGDPEIDELLQAASEQAIQDGPPPPDPKAFMAKFWARQALKPEDPPDPEPPHIPPAA